MNAPHDATEAPEENPIAELQALIEGSGEEVGKLFGPALTIFAGASAGTKDPKQKLAELEGAGKAAA